MYSRFSGKQERVTQLPEHYGGYAFSRQTTEVREEAKKQSPPAVFEVAKPTPPPREDALKGIAGGAIGDTGGLSGNEADDSSTVAPLSTDERKDEKKAVPTGLFGGLGNAFPFSHGIGFEELLILGLILLLAREDGDRDAILWLGLLLFCG